MRYRVLSPWTIAVWAVVIVAAGTGVAVWLLLAYTGGNAEANRVQLDAIRTAGTIVVGTGGAAALLLAARRQRTAEIALKQKDRDQADVARAHALQERVAAETRAHQERVALNTEADATARRITDLYTKAADQLGSDKAPVRLAGLYALERLAQDHPEQRQTIVNVLCAYLRMPFTLPGDPPADDAPDQDHTAHRERKQEREVRLTAQRLLTEHLRPGQDAEHPVATFWADIDLDLTGATLINLDLSFCALRDAQFAETEFVGRTGFIGTRFTNRARFDEAAFVGHVWFDGAAFAGDAWFAAARFVGNARFAAARFVGDALFTATRFVGDAWFDGTVFAGKTRFDVAEFVGDAWFDGTEFAGTVSFVEATFTGNASFEDTAFATSAWFDQAKLPDTRYAGSGTPEPWTHFGRAGFALGIPDGVAAFVDSPDDGAASRAPAAEEAGPETS